ncbi:hypothetical protein [Actinomadura vinacea]|uniref:hypothetical protein n=1 Tax=Actinomadura vinacea TaxID=115336 RepID=UPI0031CE5C37
MEEIAERRLGIPRPVSQQSVSTALALDGELDADALNDFLDHVFAPSQTET